ncbi:MAG: hypothetical protein HY002_01180 [Candidatus Rokubacteria bacterium]|nr:hypothetical protein [Candidatus Rokubacteria bacterium]
MSGILGIWNLDGRPVDRALLAELSATLAHRGPDGEGLWRRGSIGLACRLFRVTPEAARESQPLVHAAGAALVFDGRLDDREELLERLGPASGVAPDSPDPDLVLAAYLAYGDRFPERLAGEFALALFDPAGPRLLLARDAIGIRPLYYVRTGNAFLFASELKALLAHPEVVARPDDDVLASFLLDRGLDGRGATFFAGMFSLPPAHLAVLTPEGFATRRYWDFDLSRPIRLGSIREYAEAFHAHFARAVRRRLRSAHPVAVSLSGGLDSSSIFCVARTLARQHPDRHPRILGVSYTSPPGSPSDEAAFLVEIERQHAVTVERVPLGRPGVVRGAREAVWHVEAPFLDELWDTSHRFLTTVHRLGARVLLTGHWGDQVLFDQAYLVDLVRRLAWRRIRAHLGEFGRWFTDAGAGEFRRRFLLDLVKYHLPAPLVSRLRRLRRLRGRPDPPWYSAALRSRGRRHGIAHIPAFGVRASAHARALYEQARSSRHGLCLEWDNKVAAMHGLEMTFPFLDRDLLAFLMAIPGEMQTWQGVPKALLREALPGVLPEAIRRRTWKADFTYLVNAGVERDLDRLARCLETGGMAMALGYVSGDVLRQELERLNGRLDGASCETAWRLSDLLGLELWLQVFFSRDAGPEGPAVTDDEPTAMTLGGAR